MYNCEELEKIIINQAENLNDDSIQKIYEELLTPQGRLLIKNNKMISAIHRIVQTIMLIGNYKISGLKDKTTLGELIEFDNRLRFFVYKVYSYPISENTLSMFLLLINESVSVYFFAVYASSLNIGAETTILNISKMYDALNNRKDSIILLNAGLKLIGNNDNIRNKLIEEYSFFGMEEEALRLKKEKEQINE